MSASNLPYHIDRRAGQQGLRPSVRGQAEVEKFVTGHHYSEVTSSERPKSKGNRTHNNNNFFHNICIGSINTRTIKNVMFSLTMIKIVIVVSTIFITVQT